MNYICIAGFIIVFMGFVAFCWMLGSLADTMVDDSDDVLKD